MKSFDNEKYLILKLLYNFTFVIILLICKPKSIDPIQSNLKLDRCYLSPDNSNLKIMHLILTRYLIERKNWKQFLDKIYQKEYIINGIRVIKKYLLPSLENQSCKNFKFIIILGDKANISLVESLLNINTSLFETKIIYQKNIKSFIKNISNGFDILITTRIDYDDRIYYDAVNDVRKAINVNKPMILYGYNKGVHYYEFENKYYDFSFDYKDQGCMSIFVSLIIVLNKINDTYNIYDLGIHPKIRSRLLNSYNKFGLKGLSYEPAIFDSGTAKFVWVRHKYSGQYKYSEDIKKNLKEYNFNLSKFYGK